MKNKASFTLIAGIMLFVIGVFLSVLLFSQPAILKVWDLSEKGPVGDALNGMTAPVIGTVGAILIFVSFNEQVKANKLQFTALRHQRELDITFKFYMELKEDLKEIQERFGPLYHQPAMLDAFMQEIFNGKSQKSSYPELYNFIRYLNDQFMFLSLRLLKKPDLSNDDSMAIIEKLKRLYGLYFASYYDTVTGHLWPNELGIAFRKDICRSTIHRFLLPSQSAALRVLRSCSVLWRQEANVDSDMYFSRWSFVIELSFRKYTPLKATSVGTIYVLFCLNVWAISLALSGEKCSVVNA